MLKIQQQLPLEGLAEKSEVSEKQSPAAGTLNYPDVRKKTYASYAAMKGRCKYPCVNGYKNYGGRGIAVCERWLESFANFVEDMGLRPLGMQIDRIDVNGNYEPPNCRWATPKENASNRRYHPIPFTDGEPQKLRMRKVHRAWVKKNKSKRYAWARAWANTPEQKDKTKIRNRLYYLKNRGKALEYRRKYLAERKSAGLPSSNPKRCQICGGMKTDLLKHLRMVHGGETSA